MSDQPPAEDRPIADFESAIALRTVGDGHLEAEIQPGWDVRGIPNGGYLLALVAKAASTVVAQPDPLSVSATYLAPPRFGPADLTVEVVRAGRRQSTVAVELRQSGNEQVRATVTLGTLSDADPIPLTSDVAMPDGFTPDQGVPLGAPLGADEPLGLSQRIDQRLRPGTGFNQGRPTGTAQLDAWLRLADGSEPDPWILLMLSDGMPPSILEARGTGVGHVPTIQLTTHLFARPRPGWVRGRFRTRVQGGAFVDEDGDLWDSDGRLVATTRQLALLR